MRLRGLSLLLALLVALPALATEGPYLVLLRHGESVANRAGQFAGWRRGVSLTDQGRRMALDAGKKLRGLRFGKAYSSSLERAKETLALALEGAGQTGVPVAATRTLNERRYGVLEGKTPEEATARFGEANVKKWRADFDAAIPGGESLRDVQRRAVGFIDDKIMAELKQGKNVLVATHRHTMRAIAAHLEGLGEEAVRTLAPENVEPFVYQLGKDGRLRRVTLP